MYIGVDFDGTCVTHEFPKVGRDIGAAPILKRLVAKGHQLILFTMRCDHPRDFELKGDSGIHAETGSYLSDAISWFRMHEIPLYGIQTNPTQHKWTTSPKAYCHLYIDDAALGVPLIHPKEGRPYVDWDGVEDLLISMDYL